MGMWPDCVLSLAAWSPGKAVCFTPLLAAGPGLRTSRPLYLLLCPPAWVEAEALCCACYCDRKIGPGVAHTLGRPPKSFCID